MKIVGIQSSPRGKNSTTLKLLEAAMEGARESGAETEIIDITRLKIYYCKGDISCYKTGCCPQKDDFPEVLEKMLQADGIIFSSPNYITNVTAQFKTMLDRMGNVIHEQRFDGKYGFSITTAGGPELDFIIKIMNDFIITSGGNVTGSVGYSQSQGPAGMETALKKAKEAGKDLAIAINEKRRYPDQEAFHKEWRERFGQSVKMFKEHWAHNYEYWLEKGWI
mgnify:CR=1 FL=1